MRLAEAARTHGLELLGVARFDAAMDVFFVESRAQMDSLVGFPVTGFAIGTRGPCSWSRTPSGARSNATN